ncbi:MAG: nitronate monooxygenase family protein [Nevskia sp.]|nr:nitronate monooxygenase family protein [Nevskia sp.]
MSTWPDTRILDLLRIELPIVQAPMAGAQLSDLAIAVAQAGGLGSLPCAAIAPEQVRREVAAFRQATTRPLNVNFFCHQPPAIDAQRDARWKEALLPYYREFGLMPDPAVAAATRAPFDETLCALVEELRPEVVSFHFGLPPAPLLERVKASGARVLSSATTVEEAVWLERCGCDAIIAQGCEAGGHRGMFLGEDISRQPGTMALVPQIVDAVKVPVIASGGIGDARGIAAAFVLGAAAVQLGTAYLFCPEATIADVHRAALRRARDDGTALTNLYSGRPARGIVNRLMRELGPMSAAAPAFPLAGSALTPLRAKAEAAGSGDFQSLWAGQAAALGREMSATELTRRLAEETLAKLAGA